MTPDDAEERATEQASGQHERPPPDPEVQSLQHRTVEPGSVPSTLPGALPENTGRDPADVHREGNAKPLRRR